MPVEHLSIEPTPLTPGSSAARLLYEIWSDEEGRPRWVGRARLGDIAVILEHLHLRAAAPVKIEAMSEDDLLAVAGRLREHVKYDAGQRVWWQGRIKAPAEDPYGVNPHTGSLNVFTSPFVSVTVKVAQVEVRVKGLPRQAPLDVVLAAAARRSSRRR